MHMCQTARYVDRRGKSFKTVLGSIELFRAYYHCAGCEKGFYPRDRQLGLSGRSCSPGVLRMIGTVGSAVGFQEGSGLLRQLAGLDIDAKQVERYAEALGAEIAADERIDLLPMDESVLPHTLYLGIDGTGVPIRQAELEGRTGKQPDGSSQTREVKLCTVWSAGSAEGRDGEGCPVRDPGSVTYTAAIESAAAGDASKVRSDFAGRVLRETTRRRFCQARRTVVPGDGAPWIWNIAQELFPKAIQIVDRFHVKQALSDVAKAVHPPTSAQAAEWAKLRRDELDDGKLSAILGGFASTSGIQRRRPQVLPLYPPQPPSHAIPAVSRPWGSALPPVLSRPAAKSPLPPDSNAPVCTGRSAAPIPLLLYAATSSADARKLLGASGLPRGCSLTASSATTLVSHTRTTR